MFEQEMTQLFSEIHNPAFGSEVDKALKASRLNEMKARAVVREVATRAEADNLPADEFVSQAVAALYGQPAVEAAAKVISLDLSDRRSVNNFLREHGYRWSKTVDWRDEGEQGVDSVWILRSPNGDQVTVREALSEIGVQ